MEKNWLLDQYGLIYWGDPTQSRKLSRDEVRSLFKQTGFEALYVRNIFGFESSQATQYWLVLRDRVFSYEDYPSKVRLKVRRSVRAYLFKRVGMSEMREVGYRVYKENWKRLPKGKHPRLQNEQGFQVYLNKQEARNAEFWIGYSRETGEAAMWSSVYLAGESAIEETVMLSFSYKSHYPTYGLYHVMANYYIQDRGMRYFVAGGRSATEHSNVQPFLLSTMGFRRAFCKLQFKVRFPFNVFVMCCYPFRRLLPKNSGLQAVLRLYKWAEK